MWRRQKKAQTEDIQNAAPSLALQADRIDLNIAFSNKVVNSIRQLLARIESRTELDAKLGIISAIRGEGVSYMTQAISTVMANDLGVEICIVDLNWWESSYQNTEAGLSDVVLNDEHIDNILIQTNYQNLSILPAGQLSAKDKPVVARSEALYLVLLELEKRFDYLILDIPAILSVSEAVPLATLADICCVVIHQGATSSSQVRLALDEVRHLNLLGVVMNQVETYTPRRLLNLLPIE